MGLSVRGSGVEAVNPQVYILIINRDYWNMIYRDYTGIIFPIPY